MKLTDEEIKQDHYYDEPKAKPKVRLGDWDDDTTWHGWYSAKRNRFYERVTRFVKAVTTAWTIPYLMSYFGAFSASALYYESVGAGIVGMWLWFVVSFCFIQPGRIE